jgi:DNA-binding transcriptional LysR family regulator
LVGANHPLAQYEQIPWSELIRYPQVVFKDGYGMQRLVQERFDRLGATLQAVLEVNTLDAFRGVARQGELIALLPQSALVEARLDPTLAVRAIASTDNHGSLIAGSSLSRQVVMVTSQDRLSIPPIQHFWQLVRELVPPKLSAGEEGRWGDKGELGIPATGGSGDKGEKGDREDEGEFYRVPTLVTSYKSNGIS